MNVIEQLKELEKRVERLEAESHNWLRFFFQYLFSPLLLVGLGAVINVQLENAKNQIIIRELEAAQSMLDSQGMGGQRVRERSL
ncbi:MAG: hypothetical protein GY820_02035 [Gammaproteobacteria bacterium]|nr:hypothetical protein [Gammaproteobacteria bacterium]